MKLLIKNVDMNGWLGREFHPVKNDEGLEVVVIGMELLHVSERGTEKHFMLCDGVADPLLSTISNDMHDRLFQDEEHHIALYTAVTRSGRILNLLDFEVEVVSPERDLLLDIDQNTDDSGEPDDAKHQLEIIKAKVRNVLKGGR